MKKKLGMLFTAIALVLTMAFLFCACSTYGGIKSAFKKEGYEEIEATAEQKEQIKSLVGDDYDSKVIFHVLQKQADENAGLLGQLNKLSVAIIIEFKSNKDMEDSLKSQLGKDNVENVYEELQKLDTVNGNCTIISISPEALKIFKEAK